MTGTKKIILIIILIFAIVVLIPYIGGLISLIFNPTFSGNENKPYVWLHEGQKLQFVSNSGEKITIEIKAINYNVGITFTSGFYRKKTIMASIGNKQFLFMGASKFFISGTALYEEQSNYCPTINFNIPNDLNIIENYLNNYNYGHYKISNPQFDQSLKIDDKTYNDITISTNEVYLDKNNISQQKINYTNDIKNGNIKLLKAEKLPNIETDERPYFIDESVWWSKTQGLIRYKRESDRVIFTRIF